MNFRAYSFSLILPWRRLINSSILAYLKYRGTNLSRYTNFNNSRSTFFFLWIFHPLTDHTILEQHFFVFTWLTPCSLPKIPPWYRELYMYRQWTFRDPLPPYRHKNWQGSFKQNPNPCSSWTHVRIHWSYNFSIVLSFHDLSQHLYSIHMISMDHILNQSIYQGMMSLRRNSFILILHPFSVSPSCIHILNSQEKD